MNLNLLLALSLSQRVLTTVDLPTDAARFPAPACYLLLELGPLSVFAHSHVFVFCTFLAQILAFGLELDRVSFPDMLTVKILGSEQRPMLLIKIVKILFENGKIKENKVRRIHERQDRGSWGIFCEDMEQLASLSKQGKLESSSLKS